MYSQSTRHQNRYHHQQHLRCAEFPFSLSLLTSQVGEKFGTTGEDVGQKSRTDLKECPLFLRSHLDDAALPNKKEESKGHPGPQSGHPGHPSLHVQAAEEQ